MIYDLKLSNQYFLIFPTHSKTSFFCKLSLSFSADINLPPELTSLVQILEELQHRVSNLVDVSSSRSSSRLLKTGRRCGEPAYQKNLTTAGPYQSSSAF